MQPAAVPGAASAFPKWKKHAGVLVLLIGILFLDSRWLAERFAGGQWIANVATALYFYYMYRTASPRLGRTMIIGLFVATAGEVLFSLVIGMYEYRLGNVPIYVPPGHCILYATVYEFIREPGVLKRSRAFTGAFYAVGALFSAYWLWAHNDVYGFLCFAVFSLLIGVAKDSRLFFVTMFLLVAYLELIGTSFRCWFWHPILLNKFESIPSGNPPSGISVFYMGFDIACLGVYMLSNLERRARYDSFKAFRKRKRRAAKERLLPSGV